MVIQKNEDEMTVPMPSPANVEAACEAFNREDEILEAALAELFRAYPENTVPHHVLLKVTALNALYSTYMPVHSSTWTNVLDVAEHICRNGQAIDRALETGLAEIVDLIAKPEAPGKRPHQPFSFATKYCSWHKPECYPIWDSRVRTYLRWLQKEHGFAPDFPAEGSWKYVSFRGVIETLRKQYDLEVFSFKQLDKFLYRAGNVLIERDRALATSA